ncbi:unnamed protein product [Peronospora farinosa]|uniref:Uncharacterized protein n=1 Tax=Peronospora farinosa TaxID=134698 RepID=A0AAV0SQ34_9STRA|nr:unnamed protein product [Peronospora farinosa]CAI5705578.1 unnamed protein product [Peronospora farinosa]
MNGTQEAPTGTSLAAHFETKRRILATVKQMEKCNENVKEATPDEILEALWKSEETVFKFKFQIAEEVQALGTNVKKNRKRKSKRKAKKKLEKVGKTIENVTSGERLDAVVPMMAIGTAKDKRNKSVGSKQMNDKVKTENLAISSSFLKLRKATGTESEVAKMHLRYGQGRRNLAAMKQRQQRKMMMDAHTMEAAATSNDFKFNFTT